MEFTLIENIPTKTLVRLPDQNVKIRRIFPVDRLLEIVKTHEMALVPPSMWEDPREDIARFAMLDGDNVPERRGRQQSLEAYLMPAWGQCWSLNPGSDALLRAYSRVNKDQHGSNTDKDLEGVTVTTTVSKVLSAAEGWHDKGADCHVLMGRVEYLSDQAIRQDLANACGKYGPQFFRTIKGRCYQLLQKREYFRHEEEVRLLMVSRDKKLANKIRKFEVNPNELFESVSFDPRLTEYERRERETELRSAGYLGAVVKDDSYQGALFQILMDRNWIDP